MNDEFFMSLAINEAWKYQLLTYPNPAVGAVVVRDGAVVSVEAHQKAGSSHAEVLALVGAYESMTGRSVDFDRFDAKLAHEFLLSLEDGFFKECEIYVTLEPCSHKGKTPSCASLLQSLKLRRVIIGLLDPIDGHGGGTKMLERVSQITLGVNKQECKRLLEPFLIWQERAFVVFKIAQSINGRIGGGYLSSKASLTHTHKIRSVCSSMLIGGNTIRVDRPTLDCRFVNKKAPDIYIYSKDDNFDRDIPLFGVANRRVDIGDDLSFLQKPSLVLVEGGNGMINALQKYIDWFIFYTTPKLSCNNLTYNTKIDLEFLHFERLDVDILIWSKKSGH
jgi:diaminohydroxyphosphoribosylaminopyrimidine deaminase/5-amino-6-(5-phosphoribosylamino)uracil reductase